MSADESPAHRTFRENLRHHREQHGWSQGELARRLRDAGWSALGHQTTVNRLESGQRAPRLDEALAIARALEADLGTLLAPPEAIAVLDATSASARDQHAQWRSIVALVDGFHDQRASLARLRTEVARRIQAGEYSGDTAVYAEQVLTSADQALARTAEEALDRGRRQWEQFDEQRAQREDVEAGDA